MCIGLLEKLYFHAKYVFWKTESKKLANSENFAKSEISLETFADSEPRAKFSVFPKILSSSLGFVAIGGCLHNLLRNKISL
jgi:hypothetical protein